jgi:hypothetical protein
VHFCAFTRRDRAATALVFVLMTPPALFTWRFQCASQVFHYQEHFLASDRVKTLAKYLIPLIF